MSVSENAVLGVNALSIGAFAAHALVAPGDWHETNQTSKIPRSDPLTRCKLTPQQQHP